MREKLLELLKSEGLKPSQLAEILEINPAGISHILAGRNKPSFELLQKILRRFPRINPDWLLLDSDQIYRDESSASTAAGNKSDIVGNHIKPGKSNSLFDFPSEGNAAQQTSAANRDAQNHPQVASTIQQSDALTKNRILRIVIFYEDQTFETYTPTIR